MLNKIIHFSLQNRILVLLVTLFLAILGIYVTIKSEIDVFPDLNAPTVVIMTEAPGYAPEEIEKTVTFPIETVMNGATGVRRVRSSSTTGFSTVSVEFDWGTDIYQARQTVMEKLTTVSQQFPAGVEAPVLGPQTSILGEMLIVSLTADSTSLLDLRTIADRTIRPRLLALGGVSEVQVIGGDIKEYQILLDLDKMKYYNISLQEVADATENVNNNVGGGILYEYGNEYIVKGNVNTRDLDVIAQSVVKSDSTGIVTIADIATVKIGSKTPKLGMASENGMPAVSLTITKQPNSDTNELTEKIISSLDEIKDNLPSDVNISTDTFMQSRFINNSISNIEHSLVEGAIFVVIVLFLFLMNFRTTIISLVALPLSVLTTMIILHYIGYTINTMILGGIAIAIGSLVDDAIVDVENVYRRLRENRELPRDRQLSVIEIVNEASREVRMPIFNSSLIIMASFLPLFFLTDMEGRLLIPLGVAFIVSLLASTIVALTVTPVLCSYLLKADSEADVKLELLRQYLTLFSYYKQRDVLQRNIEESEIRLKDIRKMKEEGLITNNDVLRSELQLTNDRLALTEAENSIALASMQLDILLGIDESLLIVPDTTLLERTTTLTDYEACVNDAYENNTKMQIARQQTALARNETQAARNEYLPQVSLYAGNTLARPITRTMADQFSNSWNIGVTVSYSLSSLYKNRDNVGERRSNELFYQNEEERLEQSLRMAIRQAYLDHTEAIDRVKALTLSVRQARENYRIVQNRYLSQLAILTDLLDANSVLLTAELELTVARVTVIYTYYELLNACGRL